jgi:hypothetical protein
MSDDTMSTTATPELLSRRDALQRVSALLGGAALIGHAALLTGCAPAAAVARPGAALLSTQDLALLDEIADTILPATSTPGAKAAGVGPFIATMVADAYSAEQQRIFRAGLDTLERESRRANGTGFVAATPRQRLALLERIDREQFEGGGRTRRGEPHYFRMLKELTLLGYFTSEIGYTQALRYAETPGRFDPCIPYKPGDKAWAPHA